MNINRFLENSTRTCVSGKNIYTNEGLDYPSKRPVENHRKTWRLPVPGLNGTLYIGHCTDIHDPVSLRFFCGNNELNLSVSRHRWTPAWTKTHYRSDPEENGYPVSGMLSVCETKCFNKDDVFVSKVCITSDKRFETSVRIDISSSIPEMKISQKITRFSNELTLDGFFAIQNSISDSNIFNLTLPPHSSVSFSYAFCFDKNKEKAKQRAFDALKSSDPFAEKEQEFNNFFEKYVPELKCEDMDMLKMYYYRWYVVYRSIHSPSDVLYNHEIIGNCVYESPTGGGYDCPVGLPVALHWEEIKWMKNPDVLFSDIYNFNRELDYYWKYYIEYTPMSVWHVFTHHNDKSMLADLYPQCKKYALKDFKPEKNGLEFLPTMCGSWCTGAEYQPAFYQYTETPWDWIQDNEGNSKNLGFKKAQTLYRLDHISYSIANLIGTANIAHELEFYDDEKELRSLADRAVSALKNNFWSEKRGCFVSIDVKEDRLCDDAVCYDSFLPFLWNMIGTDYHNGFEPLFDPLSFSGEFSATSVDKHCPMYWFDNCIAGPTNSSETNPHFYGCSWNGPIWPYAVSGIAEALGAASTLNPKLSDKWTDLFNAYTEVQFYNGDRSIPLVLEHYRPTDGTTFNITCDYFHSTWIDLFIKYWAGIRVDNGEVLFNPITNCEFTIDGIVINGISYKFEQKESEGKLTRTVSVNQK